MKVAYILHTANKYDGSSKSFCNMLKGLIKRGIEPYIVLPDYGPLCEYFKENSIPFWVMPCPFTINIYPPLRGKYFIKDMALFVPRFLYHNILLNLLSIHKLYNHLKKVKPDIIHSNTGVIHAGFVVAKKLCIPHIWHLREYQTLDFGIYPFPSLYIFKKKLKSKDNYCIAITKGIFKFFSLSAANSKIIYNGALYSNEKKYLKQKENYFLYAGTLAEHKGIEELINVFTTIMQVDNKYSLYIAGDTGDNKYKKRLVSLVEKNELTDRILFLGMRDDIYDLMANATALIVPSRFEGFGRITAEAMFNGCLVIGHNTGGTREILEAEHLGLLYSSEEELVRIMMDVISGGIEQYYPMILKAQERAGSLYSIEQNVNEIFTFYMDMAKSNQFKLITPPPPPYRTERIWIADNNNGMAA